MLQASLAEAVRARVAAMFTKHHWHKDRWHLLAQKGQGKPLKILRMKRLLLVR